MPPGESILKIFAHQMEKPRFALAAVTIFTLLSYVLLTFQNQSQINHGVARFRQISSKIGNRSISSGNSSLGFAFFGIGIGIGIDFDTDTDFQWLSICCENRSNAPAWNGVSWTLQRPVQFNAKARLTG